MGQERQLSPRKGMPSPRMTEEEFKRRFLAQFQDQNFDSLIAELERVAEAAWTLMRMREKLHTPAGPEQGTLIRTTIWRSTGSTRQTRYALHPTLTTAVSLQTAFY
jgi:hypothetical protein